MPLHVLMSATIKDDEQLDDFLQYVREFDQHHADDEVRISVVAAALEPETHAGLDDVPFLPHWQSFRKQ